MNIVSADSASNPPAVPRSSRQLITGEAASQSTNLPAENPAAVRVQPVDHRSTVGGSSVIMGTDEDPFWRWRKRRCRSALSAPDCHRRTQVLALRRERRAPSPLWYRATQTADRSGPDRRHECVEFLGRVGRPLPQHATGVSGAPAIQDKTKGLGARRRQRGDRAWHSGQAL